MSGVNGELSLIDEMGPSPGTADWSIGLGFGYGSRGGVNAGVDGDSSYIRVFGPVLMGYTGLTLNIRFC